VDYPGRPAVLRDLTFEMNPGEILGLVGQSGSGKSTLTLAILQLLNLRGGSASGEILFRGCDLMRASEREMRRIRGREVALVPQSPMSSLNGALRIGTQLSEAWKAHAVGQAFSSVCPDVLRGVSLPVEPDFLRRYPGQLSVGQAQRVLIAMATLHRPALLIADEPTSALDVVTQSETLELFARLNRELRMGILYISHDLLSIASLCHRIGILHQGKLVELATTEEIFRTPRHPYTRRLIEAIPVNPFGNCTLAPRLLPAVPGSETDNLSGSSTSCRASDRTAPSQSVYFQAIDTCGATATQLLGTKCMDET